MRYSVYFVNNNRPAFGHGAVYWSHKEIRNRPALELGKISLQNSVMTAIFFFFFGFGMIFNPFFKFLLNFFDKAVQLFLVDFINRQDLMAVKFGKRSMFGTGNNQRLFPYIFFSNMHRNLCFSAS